MKSLRQGDIGFFRIEEIPAGFEKTGTVLEIQGESGRHLHRIEGVEVFRSANGGTAVADRPAANTGVDQDSGIPVAVIRAFEETTVIHDVKDDHSEQPHDPLKLEPGIYQVVQARQARNRRGD